MAKSKKSSAAQTKTSSEVLNDNQKRDENGQFASGSDELKIKSFNWKRFLPVVIVVALVGGFLVYRSFASDKLLAVPGSDGGSGDCISATGRITKETSGSKRNGSVCELSSSKAMAPFRFGDNRAMSYSVSQLSDLTADRMKSTGYFQACYNIRRSGSAETNVVFGSFSSGSIPTTGTARAIANPDYLTVCDPVPHKAGTSRPFIRVTSGTVRIGSISLAATSAPSNPTPEQPTPTNTLIRPGVSFFWPIGGSVNVTTVKNDKGTQKLVDFDSFSNSNAKNTISQLKALGNVHVVCYFSAGTAEDWRSDYRQFTASDKSKQLDDWEGEYILDTRSANVRTIMANRIKTMKDTGCDGIEPDNVDGYSYGSGFPLTRQTALDYLDFLQKTAHDNGMTVALKNSGDLVTSTLPSGKKVTEAFDWALIEECYKYKECDAYRPFVQAGKAAVIVEYDSSINCSDANSKNYDAYRMDLNLSGNVRTACRTL